MPFIRSIIIIMLNRVKTGVKTGRFSLSPTLPALPGYVGHCPVLSGYPGRDGHKYGV